MSGADIVHARARKKLSQHDLARLSGYSTSHIRNLETGRRPITLTVARRLDRVLHFPMRVLVKLVRSAEEGMGMLMGMLV